MFNKILIANRGEIACRVAATAKRLGVASVAVYSDADAKAKHVAICDEAVHVGGSSAAESYLRIEKIIDAALKTGAQAIHPGYGFLSENEAFALACENAGLVFIGPPVAAISAMGSKAAAKALMHSAAVPLVPGYHGDNQSFARFAEFNAHIFGHAQRVIEPLCQIDHRFRQFGARGQHGARGGHQIGSGKTQQIGNVLTQVRSFMDQLIALCKTTFGQMRFTL